MLTRSLIENLLILIGESFWVFSAFAQLRKLHGTKNKLGLSVTSEALNTAGCVAWAVYFASLHLWVPFVTNTLVFSLGTAIVFLMLTDKRQFYKGLVSIIGIGILTSYLLIKFPDAGGWVGVTYNTIATAPWVWHVVTTKKTSGISERALFFALGAMLCTLTYALLIHSAPLVAGCLIGLSYEAIIMRYYYRYRHAR